MMKTTVVCLIAIAACSCRQVEDGHAPGNRTMKRYARVERLVKEHLGDHSDYDFEITGGLTISQIERDLIEGDADDKVAEETSAELSLADNPDWQEFVSRYEEGGDLYYFKSDRRSWTERRGIEGYVVIHKDKITGIFVSLIN